MAQPLSQSADILVYLNDSRPEGTNLSPKDDTTTQKMNRLIDLVHSDQVSTNIILLEARNHEEMKAKQSSVFNQFISNRQNTLEKYSKQFPEDNFYRSKRDANGAIHQHYVSSARHDEFFKSCQDDFRGFAAGMDKLESLIVLPYAAGSEITFADFHIVPWLAHSMMGAGAEKIDDLDSLERLLQVTVPDFKIGPKTREWWKNIVERESVKKVYPYPH